MSQPPKHERQAKVAELIRKRRIGNQAQLVHELQKSGIDATQASVSRDLNELGVVKVSGVYRLPTLEAGQSALVDRMSVDRAGDNLVIVKTGPGHAQLAAVHIDKARISGIIGTVAGDDTLFIAVAGRDEQTQVMRKIITLFQQQ